MENTSGASGEAGVEVGEARGVGGREGPQGAEAHRGRRRMRPGGTGSVVGPRVVIRVVVPVGHHSCVE